MLLAIGVWLCVSRSADNSNHGSCRFAAHICDYHLGAVDVAAFYMGSPIIDAHCWISGDKPESSYRSLLLESLAPFGAFFEVAIRHRSSEVHDDLRSGIDPRV
jgi:hypothetical protein